MMASVGQDAGVVIIERTVATCPAWIVANLVDGAARLYAAEVDSLASSRCAASYFKSRLL